MCACLRRGGQLSPQTHVLIETYFQIKGTDKVTTTEIICLRLGKSIQNTLSIMF